MVGIPLNYLGWKPSRFPGVLALLTSHGKPGDNPLGIPLNYPAGNPNDFPMGFLETIPGRCLCGFPRVSIKLSHLGLETWVTPRFYWYENIV